jgi:hypothetical protein
MSFGLAFSPDEPIFRQMVQAAHDAGIPSKLFSDFDKPCISSSWNDETFQVAVVLSALPNVSVALSNLKKSI